ncbi:hypothetical protein R1flu_012784 [Riccia fluitans]|uniref:RRM domain-containing protein n=1 Tax=Riccia fluitans TaxID=41844 RepID=A0ABD1ZFP1_9MARC
MGDKAAGGVAEGSSIFESLFGGFSNGLSIFTNNPFRRKQDATPAKSNSKASFEDGSDQANKSETGEKKDASGKKAEETANVASPHKTLTASKTDSKSQGNLKPKHSSDGSGVQGERGIEMHGARLKKVKRGEDVCSERKKRKKMNLEENAEEVNVGSVDTASVERRKRKQEESAEESVKNEEEEGENGEAKLSGRSKKRLKRKAEQDLNDDEETEEPEKRQSERQRKKRLTEQTVEGEETVRTEGSGEKRKKKMKLVNELKDSSPQMGDATETSKKSEEETERKSRSKRRPEDELERGYEKKLRESTGSEGDGGREGDLDAAESKPKGKRKVIDDDDDDFLGGRGKKRKLTKQQKLDNADKLRRTIFVGNVPVDTKAKHLISEFSQFGAVESARLRSVPLVDVKMPRRAAVITGNVNENRTSLNGYVVFNEEASAKAALAHNMKEFRGKHLRVDLAGHGSSGVEYDRKRSIFVGNLPFDAEEEELITLFQGNTPELEVEAVRVVRDPQTSAGKGIAYVCFKTKAGAGAALDKKEFIMFKNRHLRLERLGSKAASLKKTLTSRVKSGELMLADGAERRISTRKAPAPYEGERSGKRKGMTLRSSVPVKTGRRAGLPKRPALAAKKARTLQMKAGGMKSGPKMSGGKKKKEERGKKGKGARQ